MRLKLPPAVNTGAKPTSGVTDAAVVTVSPGVVALTLLQAELAPKARLLEPVNGAVLCRRLSVESDALTRRTVAFVSARLVTVALITGLNSRPFLSIELPRMTKLSLTLKSINSCVVVLGTIVTGWL